jgi:hypothetical protein
MPPILFPILVLIRLLILPGRAVVEREPHVGTAYFEMEKEYLIAKGLPRGWVRRLRARDLEEWCAEMNAAEAREKAQIRVERVCQTEGSGT